MNTAENSQVALWYVEELREQRDWLRLELAELWKQTFLLRKELEALKQQLESSAEPRLSLGDLAAKEHKS